MSERRTPSSAGEPERVVQPLDELARAAQSGDPSARERFARRLRATISASVRKGLGAALKRDSDPEDVVQDALVRVLEGLPRIEIRDERSVSRWVRIVVDHCIRDLSDYVQADMRDSRRKSSLEDLRGGGSEEASQALLAQGSEPIESVIREEHLHLALAAIARLPPNLAEVVRAIELDGKSKAQLASELHLPESTIRFRLARGLAEIARILSGALHRREPH